MKTGTVAKRFDLDPKTITGWTDMFAEFFTPKARAEGEVQRDYQTEDLWVIKTIKIERAKNVSFEQIRARLATGDLDQNLPPEFTTIEGDSAITLYAEMREMRVKLERAEAEIDRLQQLAASERQRADEQIETIRRHADEQIQSDRRQASEHLESMRRQTEEQLRTERKENQTRIEKLIAETTEWRIRYELLKEQLQKADD